jgi:hypothetical protein
MDIIGSTVISATVFFFPPLMYLKLNWNNCSWTEIVWNYIVLLLATLGSTVGLINAILALTNDIRIDPLKKEGNPPKIVLSDTALYGMMGECSTSL